MAKGTLLPLMSCYKRHTCSSHTSTAGRHVTTLSVSLRPTSVRACARACFEAAVVGDFPHRFFTYRLTRYRYVVTTADTSEKMLNDCLASSRPSGAASSVILLNALT
ncbi:hypothetical protein J6590_005903 [Homalodisca vitripennis]|nr:hypothetical protein J6590_005903 [Homalodisca vitripennis]